MKESKRCEGTLFLPFWRLLSFIWDLWSWLDSVQQRETTVPLIFFSEDVR